MRNIGYNRNVTENNNYYKTMTRTIKTRTQNEQKKKKIFRNIQ